MLANVASTHNNNRSKMRIAMEPPVADAYDHHINHHEDHDEDHEEDYAADLDEDLDEDLVEDHDRDLNDLGEDHNGRLANPLMTQLQISMEESNW